MKPRERLLAALSHEEADRVPIDIGTPVTSIHRQAYDRLKRHLGLPDSPAAIIDNMQQVVDVEEEVLQRFGADTRQLFLKPARPWRKNGRAESGGSEDLFADEWGIRYRASAGGRYFDMVGHPLAEADIEDLDAYDWPDPESPTRFEGLEERARHLREQTGCGVVLSGFGEALFGLPSWLRGHVRFYMDFIQDPDFLEALLDRMLDYALRLVRGALSAAGRYIDVVRISDDLGSEKGLIVSPEHYRRFIKPRQERLYRAVKELSDARLLLHSCGAVSELIGDFIEIGVDALNPVQVSAAGMDTAALKRTYGDYIAFWGGGCDTQHVLPFGTVADVTEEVKRRIADLAPGGGFVFAPVHNIQYDVSAEKIAALYDAALDFGRYPVEA